MRNLSLSVLFCVFGFSAWAASSSEAARLVSAELSLEKPDQETELPSPNNPLPNFMQQEPFPTEDDPGNGGGGAGGGAGSGCQASLACPGSVELGIPPHTISCSGFYSCVPEPWNSRVRCDSYYNSCIF